MQSNSFVYRQSTSPNVPCYDMHMAPSAAYKRLYGICINRNTTWQEERGSADKSFSGIHNDLVVQ